EHRGRDRAGHAGPPGAGQPGPRGAARRRDGRRGRAAPGTRGPGPDRGGQPRLAGAAGPGGCPAMKARRGLTELVSGTPAIGLTAGFMATYLKIVVGFGSR